MLIFFNKTTFGPIRFVRKIVLFSHNASCQCNGSYLPPLHVLGKKDGQLFGLIFGAVWMGCLNPERLVRLI